MYNGLVRVIVPAVIGVLIGGGGVVYLHRNDVTAAAGSRRLVSLTAAERETISTSCARTSPA